MAAAAPDPPPGFVPGQQRHEGDCLREIPRIDSVAERLEHATPAGAEIASAPVLGKVDRVSNQAGEVHSFSSRERRFDQCGRRHLAVGSNVCDHAGRGCERVEPGRMRGDRVPDRVSLSRGERPSSAAHLLPDRSFRVVHPVSRSIGTGAGSVVRSRDRAALQGEQTAQTASYNPSIPCGSVAIPDL
jgi:hypothetical protein